MELPDAAQWTRRAHRHRSCARMAFIELDGAPRYGFCTQEFYDSTIELRNATRMEENPTASGGKRTLQQNETPTAAWPLGVLSTAHEKGSSKNCSQNRLKVKRSGGISGAFRLFWPECDFETGLAVVFRRSGRLN